MLGSNSCTEYLLVYPYHSYVCRKCFCVVRIIKNICGVFFKYSIICRSYQRPNYILPDGCSNLNKSGPDKVKIKAIFGKN